MKNLTIKDADLMFSYYIRLRDADDNGFCKCITCGKLVYWYYIDNGHHIKRQHWATRFNEINCNAQCKRCNNFEQGSDVAYKEAIIKKWGEDKVALLDTMKRKGGKKPKEYELRAIINEYLPKVKTMLAYKNIDLEVLDKVNKKIKTIENKLKEQ